jgi:hypothetical protein
LTDAEARAAYLRVADPAGSPVRLVYLVIAVVGIGAYGYFQLRGWVRVVAPWLVLVGAAYYVVCSLLARRVARRASEAEIRERFLRKARSTLGGAGSLPVRGLVWLGIAGWAGTCLLRGAEFPLAGNRAMTVFIAGIGALIGARHLYEWRVEIPALRRDLAAVLPAPAA